MLLKEPRGCARPAGAMWWCHMSTSPSKSCFLLHSLISQQRSNDVRKNSLEECSFTQNMQKKMGISVFCAQENQEYGLMAPFRSYLQEESHDVNSGPEWLRGNNIAISTSLHQKVENVRGKKMSSIHAVGQSGRQEGMGSICWALSLDLHAVQHQSPCLFSGVEKWDLVLVHSVQNPKDVLPCWSAPVFEDPRGSSVLAFADPGGCFTVLEKQGCKTQGAAS